jgi:hypothetical protein
MRRRRELTVRLVDRVGRLGPSSVATAIIGFDRD